MQVSGPLYEWLQPVQVDAAFVYAAGISNCNCSWGQATALLLGLNKWNFFLQCGILVCGAAAFSADKLQGAEAAFGPCLLAH